MNLSDFSIIIPTRGETSDFQRIANHLAFLPLSISIIIVANKHFSNVPLEILDHQKTKVFFIPGGGTARVRNAGLWLCCTDYCVFLDDDVVPEINSINELIQNLKNSQSAVVTARVLSSSPEDEILPLYSQFFNFDRGDVSQKFSNHLSNIPSPLEVWSIGVGAAFALNCSIIKNSTQLAFFDENLSNGKFCGGAEDVDFFLQCLYADLDIIYNSKAVFYHEEAIGISALKLKMIRYARADGAFYAKWKSNIKLIDLIQDVLSWLDRLQFNIRSLFMGKSCLPILPLLREPFGKILGAIWWKIIKS